MIPQDMTVLHLTSLEAVRFVDFTKHYDIIDKLQKSGAFNIRNGSVTLHFDANGKVSSVEKKEMTRF